MTLNWTLRALSSLALAAAVATPALADDPRDPTMTPEAIARDRATIRRLNNEQLAYVQKRDAQYAQGWNDYAEAGGRGRSRSSTRQDSAQSDYAQARRDYERSMADWREDVAACRAGYYSRCAR